MALPPDISTTDRSFPVAYAEAARYFRGEGVLNWVLGQLVGDLNSHGIDYAFIGAVALFAHGYERFTENVDVILTAEGLEKFRRELLGRGGWGLRGYDQTGARNRVRSYPLEVSIKIFVAGEYPGEGKPKSVVMPDPALAIEMNGARFVTLEKLIELKLASGMTAPHRLKDLADVQELIKFRGLGPEFAERLDPYVREKFVELAEAVKQSPKDELTEDSL